MLIRSDDNRSAFRVTGNFGEQDMIDSLKRELTCQECSSTYEKNLIFKSKKLKTLYISNIVDNWPWKEEISIHKQLLETR